MSAALASSMLVTLPARAQAPQLPQLPMFTGDVKLACEALLCLSTGTRPDACIPSITRYFGISFKKFSDTMKGRIDFLNLCPAASMDANMRGLRDAIANGAGNCDYGSLNATLTYRPIGRDELWISNQLPDYCAAYLNNRNTDLRSTAPRYVGIPERGGHWASAEQYENAMIDWRRRIAEEDARNAAAAQFGGGR